MIAPANNALVGRGVIGKAEIGQGKEFMQNGN